MNLAGELSQKKSKSENTSKFMSPVSELRTYSSRLTWEIMVKGKSMRFWTNFVFCDHRITSQHNTTTVNLFLVVTAQRFLDKNLAWECWYDSVPYCFCRIFWARDPLSTSPTRQLWKPPNSTAVYRTAAEVHIHLPYPYNYTGRETLYTWTVQSLPTVMDCVFV